MILKECQKLLPLSEKVVEKMPVISKTQIDENLILAGDRINEYEIGKIRDKMNILIDRQSVTPTPEKASRNYNKKAFWKNCLIE